MERGSRGSKELCSPGSKASVYIHMCAHTTPPQQAGLIWRKISVKTSALSGPPSALNHLLSQALLVCLPWGHSWDWPLGTFNQSKIYFSHLHFHRNSAQAPLFHILKFFLLFLKCLMYVVLWPRGLYVGEACLKLTGSGSFVSQVWNPLPPKTGVFCVEPAVLELTQ